MERSYFIRITPREQMSMDDVINVIEAAGSDKWFVCYEEGKKRGHFHVCMWCVRGPENLRYHLKAKINGQVYISGKEIEKQVNAVAYCMKDGQWKEKNIDILTLMSATAMTKPKVNFDSELKELTESDQSIEKIASRLVDLYIKYNRKIYRQHLKSHMDLIRAKRCGIYRDNLVKYILDDY